MNLINKGQDKTHVITETNYALHFWRILAITQTLFISVVYFIEKDGSDFFKLLSRYWLLDEDVTSDVKEKSVLLKEVVVLKEAENGAPAQNYNWINILLGGTLILVIFGALMYAENVKLEDLSILSFKTSVDLTSNEFKELHTAIGNSTNRMYEMNTFQSEALKGALKLINKKLDTMINMLTMPTSDSNFTRSVPKDFGDFS